MNDDKLKDAVNRSGFPLQIKIASSIDESSEAHGWKVLYSEHAWRNDHDSGFIDLVLKNHSGISLLVVECKRVMDATWLFLIPKLEVNNRRYCKGWVTHRSGGKLKYFHWHEMTIDPATPQSRFCVVDGQDPKSKPMLERIAADVVSATETLAREEQAVLPTNANSLRIYFNVIVTTAILKVCLFDPGQISISDGKIDDPTFVEVPYVRFDKQLSIEPHRTDETSFEVTDINGLSRAKENTVFVVNAEKLPQFLSEFEVDTDRLRYLR